MTTTNSSDELDQILWRFATYMKRAMGGRQVGGKQLDHDDAKAAILSKYILKSDVEAAMQHVTLPLTCYEHEWCDRCRNLKMKNAGIELVRRRLALNPTVEDGEAE